MSDFKVTVLGSSSALPTLQRSTSSQALRYHNRYFLLDCGEGTQVQMRKYQIPFQRINEIFISHLHGDHFLGLPGLLSTMNLLGRTEGITIFAPAALEQILTTIFKATGDRLVFPFVVIPLEMDREEIVLEDETIRITAFPLNHRVPTFGFKFKEKFSYDNDVISNMGYYARPMLTDKNLVKNIYDPEEKNVDVILKGYLK